MARRDVALSVDNLFHIVVVIANSEFLTLMLM